MRRLVFTLPFLVALAAPALADDPEAAITLKDHQFTPSEVSVPAGVKVKVTVKNEQPATAEFESKVLHFEKIVTAGGQIAVFIDRSTPAATSSTTTSIMTPAAISS
jgi:hypothetical protein